MYLAVLPQKAKENFLNLALYVANADNQFSAEEQNMLNAFAGEMNISYQPVTMPLEEILSRFSDLSLSEKKIVFFELMGLAVVDNHLAKEEKEILERTLTALNLPPEFYEESRKAVTKIAEIYRETNDLIFQ